MNIYDEFAEMKQKAWENEDIILLESLHSLENMALATHRYRKTKRGKMDKQTLDNGGLPWHYSFQRPQKQLGK